MNREIAAVAVRDDEGRLLLSRPSPETFDLIHSPLIHDETGDEAARRALFERAGLQIGVFRDLGSISIRELTPDFRAETVRYRLYFAAERDAYIRKENALKGLVYLHPQDILRIQTTQILRESLQLLPVY